MQFKNPEILYALVLLVIPILIHLFQLRRFKKVEFTNVKFLKAVKLQTRKSSQLKKWLILTSRLLLLTAIVIAFAQPFIPKTENYNNAQETVIYLDNSFSMQAKGANGSLLNEIIQDLINIVPESETISLFTNTKTYKNTTLKAIKNDLITLKHSPNQRDYNAAYLKGKQLFSKENATTKNLILVSDFQQKNKTLNFETDQNVSLSLVQPKPKSVINVSIDSVYISKTNPETLELSVKLSCNSGSVDNISIALYNGNALIAKSALSITKNSETTFTIPKNKAIKGKLVIIDNGLTYDNNFYFNINNKPKIKVLAISTNVDTNFLKRIYTADEFDFKNKTLDVLNFNSIPEQNLIVINELETISNALLAALNAFKKNGGSVIVIPSKTSNINTYNNLLSVLNLGTFTSKNDTEKRITSINYDHPLLENTFNSKVTNFQYPKVEASFSVTSKVNSVLNYQDEAPFLIGKSNAFAFTAALNINNSNFKNSPLIIPVFYNIGLQSLSQPKLYFTTGQLNKIAISTQLAQDAILSLNANETTIIPLQKTYSNYVILETSALPETDGIYSVQNKTNVLEHLSFNYNRTESNLSYHNLSSIKNAKITSHLSDAIETIKSNTSINALWKWFVIFALVFITFEILLLKYLK